MVRARQGAQGEFGDQHAFRRDAPGERAVAIGVHEIESRGADRDRVSAGVERGRVRRRVDAAREPAHDAQPADRQRVGEVAGVREPRGRRVAAADDREPGQGQEFGAAGREQRHRRVRGLGELRREVGVVEGDERPPGTIEPGPLAREQRSVRAPQRRHRRSAETERRGRPDCRAQGRSRAALSPHERTQHLVRQAGGAEARQPSVELVGIAGHAAA